MPEPALVASFFTLSGAGFTDPARHTLAERCRAAADAGFTGIGLHVNEFEQLTASGASPAQIAAVVAEHGLRVVEVEFLSGWARPATPDGVQRVLGLVHELAQLFGPHHLSAGEFAAADGEFDVAQAGARLADVCRRVADDGLVVAVEGFGWSPIADMATAQQVIEASGAPNAGLLIDVWHFFNGGTTLADLARLPATAVAAVQLNDGPRVRDNLLWNARNTRLLPGTGELDVVGLVRTLDEIGYPGPYCVEVNFPQFRELDAATAARQAFAATQQVLARARAG